MSSDFLYNFVRNISQSTTNSARYDKKKLCIDLHVNYPLFLSYFNEN